MARWFALLACLGTAVAWGPDGHTIVAHIAEQFLSKDAKDTLLNDLGNITLSYASDWNDDFDHSPEGRWSEQLHFINYPGQACNFVWDRDCQKDWCNVGALVNYSHQVYDKSLSKERRLVALKFVIHMMGDIHQPLHVASGDDNGGNKIKVYGMRFSNNASEWTNRTKTLHAAWDDNLLVQTIHDLEYGLLGAEKKPFPIHYHKWQLLTDFLEKKMEGDWSANRTQWDEAILDPRGDDKAFREGLTRVATGTAEAGCKYAYANMDGGRIQTGDHLGPDYYERAKPIVQKQLAKGGTRLAKLLNFVFEKSKRSNSDTVEIVV
eukprot:TRINITY_DN48053_c0_g1_i1.p1 TRINITY_DN48053_c0_g1~~TRINITY_DN48053_c0_g1_i1.p1  ORF type:complete len:344 (+),score=51.91 TRINITY_DN48053_c0_g1_i1:71-1033(+)